ncbi:response regulator transcription factor [bacterium]|nr:response regulator transcription factor [bacterium]MCI0602615.1 response regulator transcription factor [bacterium]
MLREFAGDLSYTDSMTEEKPVRVAIIEDLKQIREGLAALIGGSPGFRCIGTFGSIEEALPGIRRNVPDLLLIDIGLPGKSGIEGIRILKDLYPDLVMLVLTVFEDDQRIFDALCAGAHGYMLKKTAPAKLLESLKDAVHGGAPISPEIAMRVVKLFRDFRPPSNSEYRLTPHEIRILELLVEGDSFKTAAQKLNVTVHTVTFHMRSIYDKLQVHSKSEAVAKALRHGLVK